MQKMTTANDRPYLAYLLRLWRATAGDGPDGNWRATIENTHTHQQLHFATLEQLFIYLMDQTAAPASDGAAPPAPPPPP